MLVTVTLTLSLTSKRQSGGSLGIMAAPWITEPVQVALTSLLGLEAKGKEAETSLQATPSSSTSCHGAFAIGSVYRIASKGSLKRSRGQATYVSRGVGVVVVDTATQASISSSSFSTSYQPITPPLVIQDGSHQVTFLALWPRTEDDAAELHVWSEARGTSSSASAQQHRVSQITRDVCSLHPLSSTEIVAYYRDGRFSVLSFDSLQRPEVTIASTSTRHGTLARSTLFVSLFDRTSMASILQGTTKKPTQALAVVVSAPSRSSRARSERTGRKSAMDVIDAAEGRKAESEDVLVEIFAIERQDAAGKERIWKMGETKVPGASGMTQESAAVSASLHPSGRFSILLHGGIVISAVLRSTPEGLPEVAHRRTLKLANLAQPTTDTGPHASILSTSSSSALVVCRTLSSTAQQLFGALLLDVELGSALAEFSWKEPENCGGLFLHGIGGSSALLLSTPASMTKAKAQAYVWNVSYEVGDENHLRWALLSRDLTQRLLVSTNPDLSIRAEKSSANMQRAQLLRELQHLAKTGKDPKETSAAMDERFDRWCKEAFSVGNGRADAGAEVHGLIDASTDSSEGDAEESGQQNGTVNGSKLTLKKMVLPQSFVSELTAIALPALSSKDSKGRLYPGRIVHFLLDRKLLRNASLPSHAMLTTLSDAGDWATVRKALCSVDDLAEFDVVELIRRVIQAEATSSSDPMQLEELLAAVVGAHLTSSEMRKAMKERLNGAHVRSILDVLNLWLEPGKEEPLLSWDGKSENSIIKRGVRRPNLAGTLSFATDVLDTFFPIMLSTPSMQEPLSRLAAVVQAHLSTVSLLAILRGPLAAFAKLDADRAREADSQLAERMAKVHADRAGSEDGDRDARYPPTVRGPDSRGGKARKPRPGASATVQVGGGTLTRSGLRDKSRKEQSYFDSMAVGLYALERFEP